MKYVYVRFTIGVWRANTFFRKYTFSLIQMLFFTNTYELMNNASSCKHDIQHSQRGPCRPSLNK